MDDDELATTASGSDMSCTLCVGSWLAPIRSPTFVLVDPRNGKFAETLWNLIESGAGFDEMNHLTQRTHTLGFASEVVIVDIAK